MADTTRSDTTARRAPRASAPPSATATAAGEQHRGQQDNNRGEGESSFVGRVRDRAEERLSAQKDRATEGMQTMVQAVRGRNP